MYINLLLKVRTKPLLSKVAYYLLKFISVEIPPSVKIGKNVTLVHWAPGLVLHPNTIIEDNVKIYQGVTLGRADIYTDNSKMESILIKEGAIICAGAKVLCKEGKLVVGNKTVVGANSVLSQSTGENEIWAGIPARKIKNL
ncbi:hypothetical protein ABER75_00480 [Niallia taxi]|uniref:serine O-acetyltransferase n=1 Tax=Niallia taxi TaxID=2499688 RepID=UPI003D2A4238